VIAKLLLIEIKITPAKTKDMKTEEISCDLFFKNMKKFVSSYYANINVKRLIQQNKIKEGILVNIFRSYNMKSN